MRGKWNLSDTELDVWRAYANAATEKILNNEWTMVDLTIHDITPYQAHQVLLSLGWDNYGIEQGTELDFWAFYSRKGNNDIVLYSSAMTFELAIYLKRTMDKINFKNKHREEMLDDRS